MKAILLRVLFFNTCLLTGAIAAEPPAQPKKEKPTPESPSNEKTPTPSPAAPAKPQPEATAATSPAPSSATPESPTLLPSLEVKKSRITDIDRQLLEKEKEIAREQKNTKATELDDGLNNAKASGLLSIFGGASSETRERLAKERVGLLEFERELTEQIKQAKTKAEKQELKKQLNELRAMRRQLDSPDR